MIVRGAGHVVRPHGVAPDPRPTKRRVGQLTLGSVVEARRRDCCVRSACFDQCGACARGGPSAAGGGCCASNVNPSLGAPILLPSDSRRVREALAAYARPSLGRSLFDIVTSLVAYLA